MRRLVYRKISCLVTNAGVASKGGVRPVEEDLGIMSSAALVWSAAEGVVWVGPDKALPRVFRKKPWRHVACNGLTAYPGLVDAHTHPVFAGDRSREFELRMRGASYKDIAAAGGGILSTMNATRSAKPAELLRLLLARLRDAHGFGVRLMEAKSGYGLDRASEIRLLEVIRRARGREVELVATCMAAHAIPPEFRDKRSEYLALVREKILPEVAKRKLAEYVDVFCDEGFFTVDETVSVIEAAHDLRLSTRLHGEELGLTRIAEKAAGMGVHSVDHLLKVDDAGIRAMARAGTVAVLLPGTALYLREPPAPARKLVDSGVAVALASDFNPGTSPTQNLPFIGTLSAISLGLTTAEIVAGLTWNAARSLRRESNFGTLLPGVRCGPVFAAGDHPSALFYRMAPSSLPDPASSAL